VSVNLPYKAMIRMFEQLYKLLHQEISGENALNMATDIWHHDRKVSYDEYAKSARYCQEKLQNAKASEAEIVTFPATGKTKYGAYKLQRAWNGRDGELHILAPEANAGRLLSYRDNPWVLARGSTPTPPEGVEAEVVILDSGTKEADYKRIDVKGKIILTKQAPSSVHELAAKHGAVGLLSDCMATNPLARPTPMDLPEAHLWLTMRPEGKLFAFILSPRQGMQLRELVAAQKKKKKAVLVRASVDANCYDGDHEMISACIKGYRQDQEVAIVAHLYEPGANDNASGAAVCLEVVRAINALIRAGKLKRPYRTIRIWLVHEFSSLQALTNDQPEATERVIAAVNVDMVGEDQARCKSHLMYQMGPDALPSFINHLTVELMAHFRSTFYTWGNMDSTQAHFAAMQTPFWGNDNFISDPSIGIPSVAFIQWPDVFYHTDHDTADKLDPESLKLVASLTASLLYTVADARLPEALQVAEIVADRANGFLRDAASKQLSAIAAIVKKSPDETKQAGGKPEDKPEEFAKAWANAHEKLDYVRDLQIAALDSIKVLLSDKEASQAEEDIAKARAAIERATSIWHERVARRITAIAQEAELPVTEAAADAPLTRSEQQAEEIVPYRKLRGIVTQTELPKNAQEAIKQASKGGVPAHMLFWVDGKRSLLEICRLTRLEDEGGTIEPARAIKWAEAMKQGGVLGFRS